MKQLFTLIAAFFISYASFALDPITGALHACVGSVSTVYDSSYTGTWSSSNTSVATVGSSDGYVSAIAAGTTMLTFTSGGSYVTAIFVVNPVPTAITGPTSLCVGSSITLTDATPGGTWISWYTSIATIDIGTGVETGVATGVTYIYYTLPGGCSVYVIDTVTSSGVDPIVGASTICSGSSSTLTDGTSGGVWTSGNTAIATVTSGGVVTGVSDGTVNISYSVTGTCGTAVMVHAVTIISTATAGTISGGSSVTVTGTTTLYDSVSGGTWTSSNTSIATINATTGVVFGVVPGTVTMTYTVSGGCGGTVYTTFVVTVTAFDGISGYVVFTGGSAYSGAVKVWLITYNSGSHDLEAVDSTVVGCIGDSVYYQFTGEPTDSYRIKASINPYDSGRTTGYIPTYHTSNFYWHDAAVLYHVSGTSDTYQEINMAYGTMTTGTGFISGDVTTGANRGTSGSIAAVGMLMVAESSTGSVIAQTTTDATGSYTFHNLPVGTYRIHPEALNYVSVDYTSVTLTTTAPNMVAANFIQHTLSKTIIPGTTGVATVNASSSSVVAFPNPTTGNLNIQWQENVNETGNVTISDITGREVFKSGINMTQGTGAHQLDLSGLTNGLYIISVKSGDINYNNKIQIQH